MRSKFINVLAFAAGAAIGSAVTWKVVKTKYDRIVQEEIESVKQVFADNFAASKEQSDEPEEEDEEEPGTTRQINWEELEDLEEEDSEEADPNNYARLIDELANKYEKGGLESMKKMPYVIEPMEFGELDGYRTFELTYYADDILEDEDYSIVTDVEDLLGPDALNSFGEYEDDAVFVRNDNLCADFQILRDYRTYSEARGIGPNKVDD